MFYKNSRSNKGTHPAKKNFVSFYLGKTDKREKENEKWIKPTDLSQVSIEMMVLFINNLECLSFKTLACKNREQAHRSLFNKMTFCCNATEIFCFNNISVRLLIAGLIRLIDPRGALVKIFRVFLATSNMI
jgi:hypothetical protein